ncbi:Cholecystokinin receptor type A [Toxocara canis]|uniref:Cholecystokinin receptor type A n=1 Tax=Toxocara canis TaxID=6265 RepID=A0A0B2UXG4_TOXCA|nr:Cholecystokinin receptor type A [Toxocara canis]
MSGTLNDSELSDAIDEETLLNVASIRYTFALAYISVFLLCVIGNMTIIAVIVLQRSMRTVTNFFLANLAVADLLVGIFCVVQNATHFVLLSHGRWPFGELLCHAYVYVLHLIPNASAGILVLMSVERFIAVLRPMLVQHLLTRGVLVASTLLVWSASATMNSPYLIAAQYLQFDDFGSCTRKNILLFGNQMNVLKVVTTINFIVWYSIPLAVLFGIYLTIGVVLFRSTNDDAVARSSSRGQTPLTTPHNSNGHCPVLLYKKDERMTATSGALHRKVSKMEALDSRRRVIRLVVVIVLSFALLSIPRYIYLMWSVWRDNREPRCLHCLSALIQPITFLLMFLNSAINPLLYAFLSKRFRVAIVDTLCCHHERDKLRTRVLQLNAGRISKLRHSSGRTHANIYFAIDNKDGLEIALGNSCV